MQQYSRSQLQSFSELQLMRKQTADSLSSLLQPVTLKPFFKKRFKQATKNDSRKEIYVLKDLSPSQNLKVKLKNNNPFYVAPIQPLSTKSQSLNSGLPSIFKSIDTQIQQHSQKSRNGLKQVAQTENKDANIIIVPISQQSFDNLRQKIPLKLAGSNNYHSRYSSFKPKKKPVRSLEEALISDVIKSNTNNFRANFQEQKGQGTNGDEQNKSQEKVIGKNFLEGHEITELHRSRMLDWMIQVFRVLKLSPPPTFFLAVSILDRYCFAKQKNNENKDKDDLYVIGLAIIFISSKFEDVQPIKLKQIIQDAGHSKFRTQQILNMEREILITLDFNIQAPSVYEQTAVDFKALVFRHSYANVKLEKKNLELALKYLLFVCQLSTFSIDIYITHQSLLPMAIVKLVLSFLRRKFLHSLVEADDIDIIEVYKLQLSIWNGMARDFLKPISKPLTDEINTIEKKIICFYYQTNNTLKYSNLGKNFPQFMGDNALEYIFQVIEESNQ